MRSRNVFAWATAFVATVSLLVNVFLMLQLVRAFGRLHWSRIFPLGYSDTSQARVSQPTAAISLALYGDSRFEMWRIDDFAILRLQREDIANLAHGGMTSAQLVLQLESQPVVNSRWSLVQVGVNDLHPLGALPMEARDVRQNLKLNLNKIAQLLRQRSDSVILSTIGPPGRPPISRRLTWAPDTLTAIDETNAHIRELAKRTGAKLLDADTLLRATDGFIARNYEDRDFFLHWTPPAYEVLENALAAIVQEKTPSH